MATDIGTLERVLNENLSIDWYHSTLIPENVSSQTSSKQFTIENDIQSAFEEIRYLKNQIIASNSHHLFLENTINDKILSTTAKQTGQEEYILTESKTKLRALKRKREQEDKDIEILSQQLQQANEKHENLKTTIKQHIRLIKTKEIQNHISSKLLDGNGNDNINIIEDLVKNNLDQINENDCNKLINIIENEYLNINKNIKVSNENIEGLKHYIHDENVKIEYMKKDHNNLQKNLNHLQQHNNGEIMQNILQEKVLSKYIQQLTGLKIKDVRADGMSLVINAGIFSSVTPSYIKSKFSHILDVVFDNRGNNCENDSLTINDHDNTGETTSNDLISGGSSSNMVADVVLEPCDASLDVRGKPFHWATREMLLELRRITSNRYSS